MCDADVDVAISTLILTFSSDFMKELIEEGHISPPAIIVKRK
jgi:DNA gyrase/topoisomerase IV subunit B